MYLRELSLENFRNVEKEKLEFFDGVNVLYGKNAQGKTNIIEAVWLFSAMKSFRSAKDADFIKKGCDFFDIGCVFEKKERTVNGEIRLFNGKRREIYKNGAKVTAGEMVGEINAVLFHPEHLSLIKNGPELRRKFLDTAICQIKPGFYRVLNEYAKVMAQRNFLLRSERADMLETVDSWDMKLAKLGGIITNTRKTYLEKLITFAEKTVDEISSGKEKMSAVFQSVSGEKTVSAAEEEKALYAALKESFETDRRLTYTSEGCHRDDFTVFINSDPAKIYGSQGQQRSLVMALKLAEADICEEYNDEYPVMLFDDVFSELDALRKAYITESIKDKQVIITSCEKADFSGNALYFNVENGKVS